MGVSGLLNSLKSIQELTHVREFQGKIVAVDAYGWLHRGSVACAIELVTGKPTRKFVDFALHRVRMLQHFGLVPYLVFDGDRLPGKAATEASRRARRDESKANGLKFLDLGSQKEAYQEFQKAIDVTPEMARQLIDELRRLNVSYVVAPYEADSQMVYLEQKGIVDAIVSEDSDLLVFGAKCLITKLDQYGECVSIKRSHFTACREMNLSGWTDAEFRCMAILSGCDYLDGIPRMGIKTAHRLVRKYKTVDRIVRGALWDGKFKVPPDYLDSHDQASKTFLYQWVYCPDQRRLVNFTSLDPAVDLYSMPYIGSFVEDYTAQRVAVGDINPISKREFLGLTTVGTSRRTSLYKQDSVPASQPMDVDKKTNNSMDAFIVKRTPLAELDPNSVQYSESQRRLLQTSTARRSWTAREVSSNPRMDATTRTARNSIARDANAFREENRVAKRRRLCAEDPDLSSMPIVHPQRSRFFSGGPSSANLDTSPEEPKADLEQKRPRSFELWSDVSAEDMMLETSQEIDTKCPQQIRRPSLGLKAMTMHKDPQLNQPRTLPVVPDDSATVPQETVYKHRQSRLCLQGPDMKLLSRKPAVQGADTRQASIQPLPSQAATERLLLADHSRQDSTSTSEGAATPRRHASKLKFLISQGSEDSLVPESDLESAVSGAGDGSDASEPLTPTAKSSFGSNLGRKRGQVLDLERFMYDQGVDPTGKCVFG